MTKGTSCSGNKGGMNIPFCTLCLTSPGLHSGLLWHCRDFPIPVTINCSGTSFTEQLLCSWGLTPTPSSPGPALLGSQDSSGVSSAPQQAGQCGSCSDCPRVIHTWQRNLSLLKSKLPISILNLFIHKSKETFHIYLQEAAFCFLVTFEEMHSFIISDQRNVLPASSWAKAELSVSATSCVYTLNCDTMMSITVLVFSLWKKWCW